MRRWLTILLAVAILGGVVSVAIISVRRQIEENNVPPTPVAVNVVGDNGSAEQTVDLQSPDPIFGPNYDPEDGLPTYICGADAFGSYFVLQQMQMSGRDVENGFHLGIVPFLLEENPAYDVSEELRTGLLEQGKWDCLLTTLDSVSLSSPGVITAVVDESAGADQLWARDIASLNDLRGKRIAFSTGSVGEYFVYYALSIARLNPRFDVTLVPEESVADAVAAFNEGRADAVSAWEPDIYDAEAGGGVSLLSTGQLRIVMDVIVTSRQSINTKADLVQSFHNAWFATLKISSTILIRLLLISRPGAAMIGPLFTRNQPVMICVYGSRASRRPT